MKFTILTLSLLVVSLQAGATTFPQLERSFFSKLFSASKPLQKGLNEKDLEQVYNVLANAHVDNVTTRANKPCILNFVKLTNKHKEDGFWGMTVLISGESSIDFDIRPDQSLIPSLYTSSNNISDGVSEIRFENSIRSFSTTQNGLKISVQSATKSILAVRYNEADNSIVGAGIYILNTVDGKDELISSNSCSVK